MSLDESCFGRIRGAPFFLPFGLLRRLDHNAQFHRLALPETDVAERDTCRSDNGFPLSARSEISDSWLLERIVCQTVWKSDDPMEEMVAPRGKKGQRGEGQ